MIARSGKPIVRLSAYREKTETRRPGALRGRIRIAPDFDQLPPDLAEAFGAESD